MKDVQTENVKWVNHHDLLLRRWLRQKYKKPDDREIQREIMRLPENCQTTRSILEDFRRDNKQKQEYFLNKFMYSSLIMPITADRGQGKTAFGVWCMKKLHEKGKRINALAPFPKIWPWLNIIQDVAEAPRGSITYVDELALKYRARGSQEDDNISLTGDMITLRHRGASLLGATQNLALIDVNIVRMSDLQAWKYVNKSNRHMTREGYMNDLLDQFMPDKGQINRVLINDNGELSTFYFELQPESKDVSQYMGEVKAEKERIIKDLLKYEDFKKIPGILRREYNIRLTRAEIIELENKYKPKKEKKTATKKAEASKSKKEKLSN